MSDTLEREQLVLEARQLVTDADGQPLDEAAAARFTAIETRLDEIAAAPPTRQVIPAGRVPASQTADAGLAAFGLHEGPPSLLPTAQDVLRLHQAVRGRQPLIVGTPHLDFATVVTTNVGTERVGVSPAALEPRRLARAAALPAETVGLATTATHPIMGAGSAATTAEGVAKSEYAAVTAGSVTPTVIAAWTDLTLQAQSIGGFEAHLRSKLAALIARREDKLLIDTVAATTGVQTHTAAADEPYPDSLLIAAGKASASEVGADADVAVLNPADLAKVFGGGTGITGESPDSRFRLAIAGMRVYPSTAQTAGTALVGSWAAASRLILGMPLEYKLDPYSGMKSNILTLLAEEAVGLAVLEPTGFVKVTFDS